MPGAFNAFTLITCKYLKWPHNFSSYSWFAFSLLQVFSKSAEPTEPISHIILLNTVRNKRWLGLVVLMTMVQQMASLWLQIFAWDLQVWHLHECPQGACVYLPSDTLFKTERAHLLIFIPELATSVNCAVVDNRSVESTRGKCTCTNNLWQCWLSAVSRIVFLLSSNYHWDPVTCLWQLPHPLWFRRSKHSFDIRDVESFSRKLARNEGRLEGMFTAQSFVSHGLKREIA